MSPKPEMIQNPLIFPAFWLGFCLFVVDGFFLFSLVLCLFFASCCCFIVVLIVSLCTSFFLSFFLSFFFFKRAKMSLLTFHLELKDSECLSVWMIGSKRSIYLLFIGTKKETAAKQHRRKLNTNTVNNNQRNQLQSNTEKN